MHRTIRAARIVWALLALLSACAQLLAAERAEPSLYARIGGQPALDAVVADALVRVAADPRIAPRFQHANAGLGRHLMDLLCERSGGPCTYRGRNMADAHEGMHISDADFDALIEAVGAALVQREVPARERGEALGILRRMKGAIVGH